MSGTPVIFNVAYTPYKLKKGSTEEEVKAHAEKRAYYDFTGDTNYLRYMTTEGKLTGNDPKNSRCSIICKNPRVCSTATE